MRQKFNFKLGFILLLIIVVVIGYMAFFHEKAAAPTNDLTQIQPSLSADQKSIMIKEEVLLDVSDEKIFKWFKTESGLCDEANLDSTDDRRGFCENKDLFRSVSRFSSIHVSPDVKSIGFTIETETLSPDAVVGIFSAIRKDATLLTHYYLGNEFLGFSPKGTYFVYRADCFEGKCGLIIKESVSLLDKLIINIPEFLDERMEDVSFIRWISDNEVEYKLGKETHYKVIQPS